MGRGVGGRQLPAMWVMGRHDGLSPDVWKRDYRTLVQPRSTIPDDLSATNWELATPEGIVAS